jgi:hypothetical protein
MEPSLIKHIPEFEILDMEPQQVEVIEQKREKPDEKESVFVRGKLKKASIIKRPIEEQKLETVDLVSHDSEELPTSEVEELSSNAILTKKEKKIPTPKTPEKRPKVIDKRKKKGKRKKVSNNGEPEESDTGEDTGDEVMSMSEDEEILEKPKEDNDLPKTTQTIKKARKHIKPRSPEPVETVTLRSHKNEKQPDDEMPELNGNIILTEKKETKIRKLRDLSPTPLENISLKIHKFEKVPAEEHPELKTNVNVSKRTDVEPKSKIIIKKKQKIPKDINDKPPAKEPVIELPNIRHSKDETQAPVDLSERTERFTIEEPKKAVALKDSHDKQDLVEIPKFINFACDMGLLGDPDNIRPMSPQAELPQEQEASLSEVEKTKDMAAEIPVEVGWSAQPEDVETISPISKPEEAKPASKIVVATTEETAKSIDLTVGFVPNKETATSLEDTEQSPEQIAEPSTTKTDSDKKPEVVEQKPIIPQEKPEIKPEKKSSRHWATLKKSLSKVRWFITFYMQDCSFGV